VITPIERQVGRSSTSSSAPVSAAALKAVKGPRRRPHDASHAAAILLLAQGADRCQAPLRVELYDIGAVIHFPRKGRL